MKKAVSKSVSLLLVLVFMFSLCVSASAIEPMPYGSKYLTSYNGGVYAKGNGVIKIDYSVLGTRIIDEIGVSEIIVERQHSAGVWIPVKTYNNTRNPELSTTNDYVHAGYVLYDGIPGETYRATITVFGNTDYRTFYTASTTAY